MVILHVKRADDSLFLYETTVDALVEELTQGIVYLHNGCLKIRRICSEIELLKEHGPYKSDAMQGLSDEQIEELKLVDEFEEKCQASDGYSINKDPCRRRCGRKPSEKMGVILLKTVQDAKGIISKEQVKSNVPLSMDHIHDCLNILKGAVTIVYPMRLPPNDPIRCEMENSEKLSGTQDAKMVLEPCMTQLWFAGKELQCGKKLRDYIGKNEKSKVIIKIQARGCGAPSREPALNDEEKKKLMMMEFRRREELKKLEIDNDDTYLDSEWSDSTGLKKSFHGLNNISWRPR